jgi:hypothetical protein
MEVNNLPQKDTFLFSKSFREVFFDFDNISKLDKSSILITDITLQIMSDLRDKMFFPEILKMTWDPKKKKETQYKMDLWEDDFLNKDENYELIYSSSTFLKNKDKKAITEALNFLKGYLDANYEFNNSKGQKITTSGGFLDKWYYINSTGKFKVVINNYFADLIVRLVQYNSINVKAYKSLKDNKKRLFYLILLEIWGSESKTQTYRIDTLQSKFGLKYKRNIDFIRNWLEPIKLKLDDESINTGISFNYSFIDDKKNVIRITPYLLKMKDVTLFENKASYDKNVVRYKASYYSRRHLLSSDALNDIKLLLSKDFPKFVSIYKIFLSECKCAKVKASDIKNFDFVNSIKKLYNLHDN